MRTFKKYLKLNKKHMSKDFSLTLQGVFVSLLMLVVKGLELDLDEGQVTEIASSLVLLLGLSTAYYGRVRKGDIDLIGRRK